MDSGGKAKKHGGSATLAYVIGFSMIHTCNWQMKRIKNLSPIFFQARLKTGKREQALEDSCEVVLEWKFNIMRCLVQNDRIRLQWQRDKDSFEILIYFYTNVFSNQRISSTVELLPSWPKALHNSPRSMNNQVGEVSVESDFLQNRGTPKVDLFIILIH